jgi:hypothetical protein
MELKMFVLFHVESTKIVRIVRQGYWQDAKFATEAAAKACATRLSKAGKLVLNDHAVMDVAEFAKIEKTEVVQNLMTGTDVVQSVNTPRCLDVSSELYWTM